MQALLAALAPSGYAPSMNGMTGNARLKRISRRGGRSGSSTKAGLKARHDSMFRSVADIDSFITMLAVACEDPEVNKHLEGVLSLPDEKRHSVIHAWVSDMLIAQAPQDFIAAIACLLDDRIAEKVYEVIYQCKRGDVL
jgi:hypothetical protein